LEGDCKRREKEVRKSAENSEKKDWKIKRRIWEDLDLLLRLIFTPWTSNKIFIECLDFYKLLNGKHLSRS
jgi:hypothetical protein